MSLRHKILFILLFLSCIVNTQEAVFVNLSENDGLPDKEFYNIIEDTKGFLWLCADKGLFRYDGKEFKNYTNNDKRGLSVFGVKEDKEGRVWCNNITGQFFYIENDRLITFIDLKDDLKGELTDFEIKKNHLFVFSQRLILKINLSNKKIENVLNNSKKEFYGSPYLYNNVIYFDQGNIYSDNLLKINDNNQLTRYFNTDDSNGFSENNNKVVYSGKSKIINVNDDTFLLMRKRNNKNVFFLINEVSRALTKSEDFKLSENEIIQHLFSNDNEVWLCTTSGIWIYEFVNNQFKYNKKILNGINTTKVIKDKDDNYWVTTLNNGVYVLPNIHINQYSISAANKNIRSLDKIESNTVIYGSTSGDVSLYNIDTNIEKIIDIPDQSRVSTVKYNPKKKISYIGLDNYGSILNHKTLKVDEVKQFRSAKSFSILNDNQLLFINHNSVRKLNQNNYEKFTHISSYRRPYTTYYNKKDKSTFISYVDDFVKYDSLWQPKTIRSIKQPIYGLSISETQNGIIWVGTFKNGIYGIKNDSVVNHLTVSNGLVSNRIEKIKADKNKLWIATDSGIQQFNTTTSTYKTLTKRDGIVSYDISGIEIFDTHIVFSSNNGLFTIDKVKAFKTRKKPRVYITEMLVNQQTINFTENLNLNHDQNTIKISFNVNGFQFNQNGKYIYRLLGLTNNWATIQTDENSITYNSLPAGKYTFQVKPVLDFKDENNDIKILRFTVKQAFWKTWWFMLIMSVLVVGGIILYFRNKMNKKENERIAQLKKIELEKEVIALNLTALRSQMNPHFIFNALNSIQDLVLKQDTDATYDYIVLFSELIRSTLDYSSQDFIEIDKELAFLKVYLQLEKLRFGDAFEYRITAHHISDNFQVPSLLIQPFVENALIHGLMHKSGKKQLHIDFYFENESLICVIKDNGVGRKKAKEIKKRQSHNHTSFALRAIEERLQTFKKQYNQNVGFVTEDVIVNNTIAGTKVVMKMPYKKRF